MTADDEAGTLSGIWEDGDSAAGSFMITMAANGRRFDEGGSGEFDEGREAPFAAGSIGEEQWALLHEDLDGILRTLVGSFTGTDEVLCGRGARRARRGVFTKSF